MHQRDVVHHGKLLGVVLMLAVLTLAGCGGGGSGLASTKLVVGSKLDPDSQLLGQMYALLLQQKGYTVETKLGLGQTPVLDSAIKGGSIDLYPEFTGTGVGRYKLQSSQDPKVLYQTVKDYYKTNLQLTWLDPAYGLNDSYALCTSQAVASRYNLHTIADVAPVASQLRLSAQQDADFVVKPMESAYGLTFKGSVLNIDQSLSYAAVLRGDADVNICYTTDPHIVTDNFVVLQDTKNVFPFYNPAPVVRDATLQKAPAIADVLNPLAAKLTTAEMVKLIKQTAIDHTPVAQVAQTWLRQQGLLR